MEAASQNLETSGAFFLTNRIQQRNSQVRTSQVMHLLDSGRLTEANEVLIEHLLKFCTICKNRQTMPTVREIEVEWAQKVCEQIRNMSRGKSHLSYREKHLLIQIKIRTGTEDFLLGASQKIVQEIREIESVENIFVESVSGSKYSNSKTMTEYNNELRKEKQGKIEENEEYERIGDAAELHITETSLLEIPGQLPLLVHPGANVAVTPVKKLKKLSRKEIPDLTLENMIELLRQLIEDTNFVIAKTPSQIKKELSRIYNVNTVNMKLNSETIEEQMFWDIWQLDTLKDRSVNY
jgi:hypothetical protein